MYIKNISFLDNKNTIIKSYKIKALPITEVSILEKCMEFFNDPEPCFIHRSAVMNRILIEFDDYFYNILKEGIYEIKWSAFPDDFKKILETHNSVEKIQFVT